ncbi:MAG: putative peptide zinc metalloprotease protein [Thermoleophilaceae bacterium]|jgi:hypothetical protein|nr:putative peptide zinc metalloprotease protein [Thermoleophilaceae bacterium]
MKIRRTLSALTAALALASAGLLTAGAQAAESGGPDNVVWSKTTGAGAVDKQSALKVGRFAGDDLESANVARAESTDCTDCRTAAVAVQAVFATGHPSTVAPKNVALAINQNCTRCTTYAYAYQYVVTTDGPVHLGPRARQRIAEIRGEVADVAQSDLEPAQMDARLNELTAEFKARIDTSLQRAGEDPGGDVERDTDQE